MTSVAHEFVQAVSGYSAHPFLMLVSDTAARYGTDAATITYEEGLRAVGQIRQRYVNILQPNDGRTTRVALALENRPDFIFHWLALNALGVSVVPLNPQWRSAELEYVLDHSEAQLVVALDGSQRVAIEAVTSYPVIEVSAFAPESDVLTDIDPVGVASTECALLYTSGTTGKPKGCMLSNEYFLTTGAWYRDLGGYCALTPGQDRLISPLPMYHMNAMAVSAMAMIMTGSCIVPLDRFHPSTWWDSVAECDATIMHYLGVMPAMLMNMEASDNDLRHRIRFGFGAGLSGELHYAFEARFNIRLIEAWAMTETGCTVAVIANQEPRKVGTACFGRPPAHMDYRLVNDAGEDVEQGLPGELLVRRAGEATRYGFFSGYLKDEKATQAAWTDGYFHTGDLVYLDEDGLMHFVDRKKNVIRRSGENISAVEVEEVIMELDSVQAVGVTSVADELRGEEVFACVVSSVAAEVLASTVAEQSLQRLAYYKAPGYVAVVEQLPLTATEKVQRAELKALAARLLAEGACIDTREMKRRRG